MFDDTKKLLVLSEEDLTEYLSEEDQQVVIDLVGKIHAGRVLDGKRFETYTCVAKSKLHCNNPLYSKGIECPG